MKFRPCIDIHNGKVKQIVGGSLLDQGDCAEENFVSAHDAGFYGKLYKKNQLSGGHVILLNSKDSPYYEADRREAVKALEAFPGGLQAGGGITDENAAYFIHKGASHVIVTSFVFSGGKIRYDRLESLREAVGRKHLVLDLSCRRKGDGYYVVTDRWQKFTEEKVSSGLLKQLETFCDEFLIHGVDVEGKAQGIDRELVKILSEYEGNPLTYAGGVRSFEDLKILKKYGKDRIDVTIGSALDLFGGSMEFAKVLSYCSQK